MLELDRLAVQAGGRRLLSDLSLQLRAGQILAVLGPNGRGKTSLLKTLLGPVSYTHLDVYKRQGMDSMPARTISQV